MAVRARLPLITASNALTVPPELMDKEVAKIRLQRRFAHRSDRRHGLRAFLDVKTAVRSLPPSCQRATGAISPDIVMRLRHR